MIRVRVRGIYATALSQLLVEKGYMLADVSGVLKNRIGKPLPEGPADVTVKSVDDDTDTILVLGIPWYYGRSVEGAIVEELKYTSVRKGMFGLYTIIDFLSLGGCRAALPGGFEGVLQSDCPPRGVMARGYVVKDSFSKNDPITIRLGVATIGLYTTVYTPGEGFSFSEHVRDDTRRLELLESVKAKVDISSVHVRFRSNSKYVTPAEIALEVEDLVEKARRTLEDPVSQEPRVVARGEYISLIYVASPAKSILDEYRSRVYPTVKYHHSLKAGGFEESTLVDFSEESMKLGYSSEGIGVAILSYILSNLKGRRVNIDHRIPGGNRITLGPFAVESYTVENEGAKVILSRTFKSNGVLDGLGVEKKPGDYSRAVIDTREWHIIHEYYSKEGKLLGVYANINTPAELSFKTIRYLDLYIDVVKKPGGQPEVKDAEELEKAFQEGLITEGLYERALKEARKVAGMLARLYT